jgi:ABC-type transport system substrate-binding protein
VYSLVYRQEVRTDDHGHFEVHEVVRALVLEGGGSYLATVALDPLASDDVGPSADFSVKSGISAPSEAVILELAVDGGAFVDPRVQQAVLAAVNRSHLSERFRGAPVTFLFSFRGNVIDTSGEPWDPDLARRLLAEAGYGNGVPVEFMYPDGDVELAVVAQDVGRDLVQLGISVELVPVSPADMIDRFGVQATAGMPVLLLIRR